MSKIVEIQIDKLTFDCLASGKEEDELVILLHGFPESAYMWRNLIEDISALGFYCIAPHTRGYSKGARPKGKKHYTLEKLSKDVMDIAKYAGRDKFHLIGHDWGAGIGWKVVHDHPGAILSWTGLSVPHIQAFFEAVMNDEQQRKMSRYIKDFQWPFIPEFLIRKNNFEAFRKLWKKSSKDEVEEYLSIFRDKYALTAALNYYRSNFKLLKKSAHTPILGDIEVPTLFIWGEKDVAIGPACVEKGHSFMKGHYQFLKVDGGHWLMQSRYSEIKPIILAHLERFRAK